MDGLVAIPLTVVILAASAFFVSVEFAVIASRRTRLEAEAVHSASARAALRNASEVSVLLAGSQLGITACTLALGAITEPALEHALEPLLEALGLPAAAAYVVAFAIALAVATFLHLVVGEMAPKSWAISHPERSAIMTALPMRAFMRVFRPVLLVLNEAANALVRKAGVEPVDEVAVEQSPDELEQLVRHSAEAGELDAASSEQLSAALATVRTTVGEVVRRRQLVTVPGEATVAQVQATSLDSGHLRILLGDPDRPDGVVHVRDTLTSEPDAPVEPFRRDLHRLQAGTSVLDALDELRTAGTQIAMVLGDGQGDGQGDGDVLGVVTIADLLAKVMPASARAEHATAG